MFSDKYGLTQAVFEGQKIMTRRIVKTDEQDCYIRFRPIETWETALVKPRYVFNGSVYAIYNNEDLLCDLVKPQYNTGDKVAIAQSYETMFHAGNCPSDFFIDTSTINEKYCGQGFSNKMFVKAELMPHHIKITNVKIERLQDISDEDCMKEGIMKYTKDGKCFRYGLANGFEIFSWNTMRHTPKEAFAVLMDKVSGRETWNRNPFVFVYEFELMD